MRRISEVPTFSIECGGSDSIKRASTGGRIRIGDGIVQNLAFSIAAYEIAAGNRVVNGRPAVRVHRDQIAGGNSRIEDPDFLVIEHQFVMQRCRH